VREASAAAEHALVIQTTQQAEGIIAFAEFSAQSLPSQANLDRILALLSSVPTWEIEASLGLRGKLRMLYVSRRVLT
jgi:hypothetical protein